MFGKKTAAVFVAISLLIGFRFNSISVPENFENPLLLKTFTLIFDITASLVSKTN
jgi:hypothetical protein